MSGKVSRRELLGCNLIERCFVCSQFRGFGLRLECHADNAALYFFLSLNLVFSLLSGAL